MSKAKFIFVRGDPSAKSPAARAHRLFTADGAEIKGLSTISVEYEPQTVSFEPLESYRLREVRRSICALTITLAPNELVMAKRPPKRKAS